MLRSWSKYLLLLFFLLPNFAHAAIALDNNTTAVQVRNATTSPYFTLTVNSNTNGIIFALLSKTSANSDTLTSCTDNGTSMHVDVNYTAGTRSVHNYIVHLLSPPLGNNLIVCALSGSSDWGGSVFSYTGVNQSDTLDTITNNFTNSGTSVSVSPSVGTNAWVVGFYQSDTNCTFQATVGLTEHTPNSGQSACEPAGDSAGAVSGSHTVTFSGTTDGGLESVVSIIPAAAPVTAFAHLLLFFFGNW